LFGQQLQGPSLPFFASAFKLNFRCLLAGGEDPAIMPSIYTGMPMVDRLADVLTGQGGGTDNTGYGAILASIAWSMVLSGVVAACTFLYNRFIGKYLVSITVSSTDDAWDWVCMWMEKNSPVVPAKDLTVGGLNLCCLLRLSVLLFLHCAFLLLGFSSAFATDRSSLSLPHNVPRPSSCSENPCVLGGAV
jgi:hypothetical protein